LVKQPPIYIFDDSFSALDFRIDATRRALKQAARKHAVHRDAAHFDRRTRSYFALNEGRIVSRGKPIAGNV
jgi:ABC-type multidrug transport system fused ATPase/permease subunit